MATREELRELIGPTPIDELPTRLCEVGVERLGVQGVGIALVGSIQARIRLTSIGSYVDALDEVQFNLGEGPSLDAIELGRASLEPDVETTGRQRWPLFADAALGLGVGAVFSFPLTVGPALFGVLDAARSTSGALDTEQLDDALTLAELASEAVLLREAASPNGHSPALTSERRVVHQASGMVAAQAGIPISEAIARLRATAHASGRTLEGLSADVVERRTRFGPR